jgi:hypothetical protein
MTDDVAPSGLPSESAATGPELTPAEPLARAESEVPPPAFAASPDVPPPAFAVAAGPDPALPPAAPVWPRVGALLSGSLDLVTQSRIPLRNASLYIGLLGVLTMGPSLLTLFAPGVDLLADPPTGLNGWTILAWTISFLAIIAISIEADIVGIAVLAGAMAGRPLTLSEALRRSRQVFWRVLRASIGVGVVTYTVTWVLQRAFDGIFGDATDAAPVGAALLAAVITAPFVYVPVGIVVGDVAALESIRRSIRLARARFRLAVVASLFAVVAQFLLVFAASAGLDLVLRALEPFRGELETLDTSNAGGFALVAVGAMIALFAYWTLTFTVSALTAAPQVVAFLGLTGYSSGLDGARDVTDGGPVRPSPARLSRPMAVGVVISTAAAVLAIVSTQG